MPRPRAAERTPETQGRVCATDAAASGSRRPGARSVRLSKIFAGHQSELGLGAAPARRRGVPGPLVVRRDVLSLGLLRVRFEFESWGSPPGACPRTATNGAGRRLGGLPEGARVPFARLEAASERPRFAGIDLGAPSPKYQRLILRPRGPSEQADCRQGSPGCQRSRLCNSRARRRAAAEIWEARDLRSNERFFCTAPPIVNKHIQQPLHIKP